MNIVYIATDSYASILGISVFSLLENTKDIKELQLYILSTDMTKNNKDKFVALAADYGRTVTFCDITDYQDFFSFSFATSGFHSIVLARLLLTKYLPATVECVLYLDSDIIVHNSLSLLEATQKVLLQSNDSAHPFAFAAVPELCMPVLQKQQIGLSKEDLYFNCGVILINLNYWRTARLEEVFIQYYADMKGKLLYNDQDILNHCCRNQILPLSHTYNLTPALYYFPRYFIRSYQPAYYCNSEEEYKAILTKPAIIHFLGEERPWFRGNFSPYRKVYQYYKSLSPWKNEPYIKGKELPLFIYHILNCITFLCPYFRKYLTKYIGIYYYKLISKK